jgi:hypothetical protein
MAISRRTEAMLSSALKHGTTRHLAPDPRQLAGDEKLGIPPLRWQAGNDEANIRSLIETSVATTARHVPEIRDAAYDPDSQTFRTAAGIPQLMKELRLGLRTLEEAERIALAVQRLKEQCSSSPFYTQRAARAARGGRNGLLVRSLRDHDGGMTGTPLRGIFYAKQGDGDLFKTAAAEQGQGTEKGNRQSLGSAKRHRLAHWVRHGGDGDAGTAGGGARGNDRGSAAWHRHAGGAGARGHRLSKLRRWL